MDSPAEQTPEVVSSEEVYRGRVIDLVIDTVREGETVYRREVVRHPGGASVVAVFEDETVALVRQYRHPPARFVLELPAGRLEEGESPAECAARELAEEVGVSAALVEPLSEFYTTPGFCSERLWVFLATGLVESAQRLEEDEIVEVVRLPLVRALRMIDAGEIDDAKTIIGLTLAARRLGVAREASPAGGG
jgi:ADP-ribose pyrophosphatase